MKNIMRFILAILMASFGLTAAGLTVTQPTIITPPAGESSTLSDFDDLVTKADDALKNGSWEAVEQLLPHFETFKGDVIQKKLLESMRRQVNFSKKQPKANSPSPAAASAASPNSPTEVDLADDDLLVNDRYFINTERLKIDQKYKPTLTMEQHVENYFKTSKMRFLAPTIQKTIKEALLSMPVWPGSDSVKQAERFLLDLKILVWLVGDEEEFKDLIRDVFFNANRININTINNFANYITGENIDTGDANIVQLISLFSALTDEESQREFKDFSSDYTVISNDSVSLLRLLPVFLALPEKKSQEEFHSFVRPYLPFCTKYNFHHLISVFENLPDRESRAKLMLFVQKPYLGGITLKDAPTAMKDLLPLFQALQTNPALKAKFELFMNPHKRYLEILTYPPHKTSLALSFGLGGYLNYERALAALAAEPNAIQARMQALYETKLDAFLPAYFVRDPIMQDLRATAGFVNVHEFDAIYPKEFELLKQKVADMGYTDRLSTSAYTIHNGAQTIEAHQTRAAVEDFIRYLDGEFAHIQEPISVNGKKLSSSDAVSLVKQMLGLEPKARTTRGVFAPYLGASMLFANPDSPKGDEVLGRVWFLMNNIISEKFMNDAAVFSNEETLQVMRKDRNNHRRSVVLAILEAAEITGEIAQTNCQTRMTGEFLKIACWHTGAESKLRKLIAFDDSLEVETEDDIKLRVQAAPLRAKNLFESIKRVESPAMRALWNKQIETQENPEPFEFCRVYFDELYGRTPVLDADGNPEFETNGMLKYKKDEHILERDARGNLVSKYNADGALRRNAAGTEEPLIVYCQAEFAIVEHEFSKRIKAELDEQ